MKTWIHQTTNSNMITYVKTFHTWANLFDNTCNFVTRHHWIFRNTPFIFHLMNIWMAYTAIMDTNENIIWLRHPTFELKYSEWRSCAINSVTTRCNRNTRCCSMTHNFPSIIGCICLRSKEYWKESYLLMRKNNCCLSIVAGESLLTRWNSYRAQINCAILWKKL